MAAGRCPQPVFVVTVVVVVGLGVVFLALSHLAELLVQEITFAQESQEVQYTLRGTLLPRLCCWSHLDRGARRWVVAGPCTSTAATNGFLLVIGHFWFVSASQIRPGQYFHRWCDDSKQAQFQMLSASTLSHVIPTITRDCLLHAPFVCSGVNPEVSLKPLLTQPSSLMLPVLEEQILFVRVVE